LIQEIPKSSNALPLTHTAIGSQETNSARKKRINKLPIPIRTSISAIAGLPTHLGRALRLRCDRLDHNTATNDVVTVIAPESARKLDSGEPQMKMLDSRLIRPKLDGDGRGRHPQHRAVVILVVILMTNLCLDRRDSRYPESLRDFPHRSVSGVSAILLRQLTLEHHYLGILQGHNDRLPVSDLGDDRCYIIGPIQSQHHRTMHAGVRQTAFETQSVFIILDLRGISLRYAECVQDAFSEGLQLIGQGLHFIERGEGVGTEGGCNVHDRRVLATVVAWLIRNHPTYNRMLQGLSQTVT